MAKPQSAFFSHHRQGFVRVAACTPRVGTGDPAFNLAETIALARRGHDEAADLMVFPELGLSAYAIDDLFLQDALIEAVEAAVAELCDATRKLKPVLVVGAPVRRNGRLYNCALAIHRGRILGVVPKTFLPNYREYYEKRWFASGLGLEGMECDLAGQRVPFGPDLVFEASDLADFVFHMEICEDFWGPSPPSTEGALAGALILCNLSASNILIGKAEERRLLCASQSTRCQAAYVFSAAGPGESTTDLAWDGQATIHEMGAELACTHRFPLEAQLAIADIDVERLRQERLRMGTFNDTAAAFGHPEQHFRRVRFEHQPDFADVGLRRRIDRFPFVPDDPARLDQDCYEAFNIQVQGLMRRFQSLRSEKLVIGVSGGLDSTHALLVACRAFDLMGLPRTNILGFTLPGFATSDTTKSSAWDLMRALGITGQEIDITEAARRMLSDIGHPFSKGEPVYDVTFENVQAGLRTDYLFRLAGQNGAIVLGTGDLSELALGWLTYGVGDHMSHYNVNGSVSKTLIQHLIRYVAGSGEVDAETSDVLLEVLGAEISPELIPASHSGETQSTEASVGPYALQDFNLHYLARYGFAPSRIAYLSHEAWGPHSTRPWPAEIPEKDRKTHDLGTIKGWLRLFLTRFFANQFKRSAVPNGPKISSGGALSPRGDWRMPSDARVDAWLAELETNVPDQA